MKPNVAVIVRGGIVQEVVADLPVNLTVIDCDTEGYDEDRLDEIEGMDKPAYVIRQAIEINPGHKLFHGSRFVKQFVEEGEANLVRDAGASEAMMSEFEAAMSEAGYHQPKRSPSSADAYFYERDQDRFVGWMLRHEQAANNKQDGAEVQP